MARKPTNPATASKEVAARVKSLRIASARPLGPVSAKGFVRQPAAPMTSAQKTRLANIHSQARAYLGR